MDLNEIIKACHEFIDHAPENYINKDDAIRADLVGMKIFDAPLIKVASAEDPKFLELREPTILHPNVMLPKDWLADADSVISFFLPFTEEIRSSNTQSYFYPSDEWLHGRIEGQIVVGLLADHLIDLLTEKGYHAIYPSGDSRYKMLEKFKSNWSERHVAYISGLGTFSLSKGLITERGVAGRFGSIVTDLYIAPTSRPYSTPFEYCTMCGMCAQACPINAIDFHKGVIYGKEHPACSAYLDKLRLDPHGPNQRIRYGCGKCQVGVPCQGMIPSGAAYKYNEIFK